MNEETGTATSNPVKVVGEFITAHPVACAVTTVISTVFTIGSVVAMNKRIRECEKETVAIREKMTSLREKIADSMIASASGK